MDQLLPLQFHGVSISQFCGAAFMASFHGFTWCIMQWKTGYDLVEHVQQSILQRGNKMKLNELEKLAEAELEEDVRKHAIGVLKSRITEIKKVELLLARLKEKYSALLDKSVDEVIDEVENVNIRF